MAASASGDGEDLDVGMAFRRTEPGKMTGSCEIMFR